MSKKWRYFIICQFTPLLLKIGFSGSNLIGRNKYTIATMKKTELFWVDVTDVQRGDFKWPLVATVVGTCAMRPHYGVMNFLHSQKRAFTTI